MASKRSVTPDGDAVRNARLGKGWRVDDLARHSDCSIKTVENVERGQYVYVNTLASIALALKVDYKTLLAKTETPTRADDTSRTKARIIVATTGSHRVSKKWVLEQLRMLVPLTDEVVVGTSQAGTFVVAPDGGLLINMTLTHRDARSVSAKLRTGELDTLDVRLFEAPDHWIFAWKPPPVEPD